VREATLKQNIFQHIFRSAQHIFIKNEATCFGYKRMAIVMPELKDTIRELITTIIIDLNIYNKNKRTL
jgi:hypothetical protein